MQFIQGTNENRTSGLPQKFEDIIEEEDDEQDKSFKFKQMAKARKSTEIVNSQKFRTSLNPNESIEDSDDSEEQQLEQFLSKVDLINPGVAAAEVNTSKDSLTKPPKNQVLD